MFYRVSFLIHQSFGRTLCLRLLQCRFSTSLLAAWVSAAAVHASLKRSTTFAEHAYGSAPLHERRGSLQMVITRSGPLRGTFLRNRKQLPIKRAIYDLDGQGD